MTTTEKRFFDFIDDQIGLQVASIALLALAMIPICTGSFSSLRTMKNHAHHHNSTRTTTTRKRRATNKSSPFEDSDDEEGEEKAQVLTIKDVFLFPIIGSGLVYIAYLTFNEIQPHYVHQAIQVITSILSCAVFSNTVILVAKNKLPSEIINKIEKYKFSFSKRDERLCHLNVTIIHLFVLITSVGLAVTYAITQHWVIGNLFAICLAINAIGALTVDSFGTGILLLLGMLAYDAFWLFGTNIMLNISELLAHAPTSIIWPRNINTYVFNKLLKSDQYFTMFGLGDIIVPGIYIAYCLRFDRLNSWKKSSKRNSDFTSVDFPKPYFIAAMLAYAVSAGASIYTVHFTKKAQSALLFIVPALILSTLITALTRNELGEISNISNILKTFNKLNSFSADENDDQDDDDDERPARYQNRTSSTRGRSTSGAARRGRSTSTTRGGRSVSRGAGRSKSRVVSSRSKSKETPAVIVKEHKNKSHFNAKEDRTIEQDVVAEHTPSKTVGRKKRSTSKENKRK